MTPLDVFEEIRFIVELLLSELLFTFFIAEKKDKFYLRFTIGAILCVGASFGRFLLLYVVEVFSIDRTWLQIMIVGCYVLLLLLTLLFLANCFKLSYLQLVLRGLAGYSLQHIEYVLINEALALGIWKALPADHLILYIAISVLSFSALITVAYFIFIPIFKNLDDMSKCSPKTLSVFYTVILVLLVTYSFIMQHVFINGDYSDPNYFGAVGGLLNSVLILTVLYMGCDIGKRNKENLIINQLLYNNEKQYKIQKETIDLINHKCHDIKHQIKAFRVLPEEERQEELDKIEKLVNFYDCNVDLKNPVLNTIITERSLYCSERNIKLSATGDASKLKVLKTIDAYTLFGNAIDNAIEEVELIENENNRSVSIKVEEVSGFLSINVTNPYERELVFKDGLPVTTKTNSDYHGFGLKSIHRITEKYGGVTVVNCDDNIFTLQILIPISNNEEDS